MGLKSLFISLFLLATTVLSVPSANYLVEMPTDVDYTNNYLATQAPRPTQTAARFNVLDNDDDESLCTSPALLSTQFLWTDLESGIYNGTLCTVLTKQSLGTPSPAVNCQPFKFGLDVANKKWVMKYPPTGTSGQHQYVFANESLVYDVAPNRCSFVENGWKFTDQVRGWNGARYDPIGKEVDRPKERTFSGTGSDVGSCGFYVSIRPKVQCKVKRGEAKLYFQGTGFSQTIIARPAPGFNIAIDVHGKIDVTDADRKVDWSPISSDPTFFNPPAVCQGDRSAMTQYCASTNPLTPDARAMLTFA